MGQSQPRTHVPPTTTPPPSNCHHHHHTNYFPNLNSTINEKLKNPKMVSPFQFDQFKSFANDPQKINVFNFDNCSIFEKELPNEVFISILNYLNIKELFKLTRVCKNYKYFWIEQIELWNNRLMNDSDHIYMYYKPILETPINSIIYYYTQFIPQIKNFTKQLNLNEIFHSFTSSKIVILGTRCGKTQFLNRLTSSHQVNEFSYPTFNPISYFNHNTNTIAKLQLWDCSGCDKYKSALHVYTRGASTLIYCFDLNNEESFNEMIEMIEKPLMDKNSQLKSEKLNMIILGLKNDLKRRVSFERIDQYLSELVGLNQDGGIKLQDLKIQYFELSSKNSSDEIVTFPIFYSLLMGEEELLNDMKERAKPKPPS